MLAPGGAAFISERGVKGIRARVDPVLERLATRLCKRSLQPLAVFQRDDTPAHALEYSIDAGEQPVRNDAVEALAVIVDHPPDIVQVVLPAFQQRLEDVALVQLGIAD